MKHMILAIMIGCLVGCAPIEKQQVLVEGKTTESTVGIGDVVAKVQATRDLKNAFGAADIWGRKTNEGYSELRYAGLEADGTIVLFRQNLNIETNEDVFTRSGLGVATSTNAGSASVYGNQVTGQASSTTIYSRPQQATAFAIPSGAIPVRVPKGVKIIPFSGVTIEIIKASPVSLTYRVQQSSQGDSI